MHCLPDGFSLATLTSIKRSCTDRVARKAPLCTHANLFTGCSAQLIKAPLHTFPKTKKERRKRSEAQRLKRVHNGWIKGELDLGKICTVHPALAVRISGCCQFKSLFCHSKLYAATTKQAEGRRNF